MVITVYTQLTVSLGSSSQYAKPSVESSKILLSQDFSFISFWNMSSFKRVKGALCPFSFPVYYCKNFPPFAETLLRSEPELCNNILPIRTKLKKKNFNSVLPTLRKWYLTISFRKEIMSSLNQYKTNCYGIVHCMFYI